MFDDFKLSEMKLNKGKKSNKLDLDSFRLEKKNNSGFSLNNNKGSIFSNTSKMKVQGSGILESRPSRNTGGIFSRISFSPKQQRTKSKHKHLRFELDSDGDGVPDFRDCRPYNPNFHSSKLIEKAVEMFGTTDDPHQAGWILPNGKYLNLHKSNIKNVYGDEDVSRIQLTSDGMIAHWEVGRAFGVSGRGAIRAFEREGAIRFRKTAGRGLYVQMIKKPTREQAMAIVRAMQTPPQPTFLYFEKVPEFIKMQGGSETMKTEHVHPIMVQKFISKVF